MLDNCLSLNVSKTKELIVDFRKRQQRPYTPLMISGTPVERVSSFKYLRVNISEDLTWTTHIQTQVKKARQRLYHLRLLRKFRVSPAILKTFYSGSIESVLTQCISVWYSNASNQDCKALQRVVRLAERISGSTLPSLQDIYLKRCKSRAVKITKDSNHPGNHLFRLLPSGNASGAWWQGLRDWGGASSLRPSGSLTQTLFHKKKKKPSHSYSHHPYCCYVYIPSTNPFAHPSHPSFLYYYLLSPIYCFCTSYLFLHILLVFAHLTCLAHLVSHFSLSHYTFYSLFLFFTYIYALVWCYFYITVILCTVHWADLIWSTFHFWLYPV